MHQKHTRMTLVGAAVLGLLGTTVESVGQTAIEEVVMYGIDADTYELLRYVFATDAYTRIGVVVDENGNVRCRILMQSI